MNFLCLNTAGKNTEIALIIGDKCQVFCGEDFHRASVTLLPEIDKMLCSVGLGLADLDFVGCVVGPGSFTGIRIGVSTVRAFCYALKKPCVTVNYCDVVAYNKSAACANNIVSVIDGSNGTAYVCAYNSSCIRLCEPKCILAAELNDFIEEFAPCEVCADEGMAKLWDGGEAAIPSYGFSAPKNNCDALIAACECRAARGEFTEYADIIPVYIRISQAEQDLKDKERAE